MEDIVKWPLSENMFILHVLYNGLDSAGRELMTYGGTFEPRALLRSVCRKNVVMGGKFRGCAQIIRENCGKQQSNWENS